MNAQFEYKVVDYSTDESDEGEEHDDPCAVEQFINELGTRGWRLTAVYSFAENVRFVFARNVAA